MRFRAPPWLSSAGLVTFAVLLAVLLLYAFISQGAEAELHPVEQPAS